MIENMKNKNMKRQTKEVRAYVKERIIALKQENMTNRAIADTLDISDDYYVRHVLEIYRKNNNNLPEEKKRGRTIGEKRKLTLKIESS